MTSYEQGFLTKCAEYGIDDGMSQGMLKQAILWLGKSQRQTDKLRQLHNEMLRRAYAGGYSEYLPKNLRAGEMPGSWLGRTWNRMWHGASGFANEYKGDMERALDEAKEKWNRVYGSATPEVRKLMRDEALERHKQYDAEELDKARAKYPLGAAVADREKGMSRQESGGPANPLTHDQFTRNEALRRNFKHNYSHVRFDERTGRWEPIDGYGLPHALSRENAALEQAWEEYQRGLNTPKASPAAPHTPGPLNAPKATW